MAITVANKLDAENEARVREFAATLTEKDRRRCAAFEAKQQGYGESNILRASSAVLDERSNAASGSWIIWIRILPPGRCDGRVPVEKNDFPGLRSRTKPEIAFGDSNGGRS
jgi:hypothetical protein